MRSWPRLMSDSGIIEQIKDLFELETLEEVQVADTSDPDVIVITIKGRVKQNLEPKDNSASDYDRAMRGITPYAEQIKD